jgi:hypothetical protein
MYPKASSDKFRKVKYLLILLLLESLFVSVLSDAGFDEIFNRRERNDEKCFKANFDGW